jgi:uncharacterized protein (TIGR02145 family)
MKQSYHFLMILFIFCFTTKLYSQSVPSYVPTNGLVGWWGFNGNAQDGSGNGNHGTVNGATLTADRFGNQNGAYNFNGVNFNHISIPSDSILDLINNFTISCWFYSNSMYNQPGTVRSILMKSGDGVGEPNGYVYGLWGGVPGTSNQIGMINFSAQPYINSLTLPSGNSGFVSINNWYHFLITYEKNSSTLNYYLNNNLIDTKILSFNIGYNSNNLWIGSQPSIYSTIKTFDGNLDDIGIWNRALTQQEITNLYNSQLPTQTSLCLPTITTNTPISIGIDSVVIGGDILNDGGSSIVLRGVCYSTTSNPNMGDLRTEDGTGIGTFSTILRNLSPSTTYYARSYAKNSRGVVVYGNEVSFSTGTPTPGIRCPGTPSVTDIDGNLYNTVQIGNQCWTQSNLTVSKYCNGDNIPNLTDNTLWSQTNTSSTGAWCNYNNDANNGTTYGKLYNWYAVNDSRGLCPTGWHVPTDSEWNIMVKYLDPNADTAAVGWQNTNAAIALKSTTGWSSQGAVVTNTSGFSALPGGDRYPDGSWGAAYYYGLWWSSSEDGPGSAWYRFLHYIYAEVNRTNNYHLLNDPKRHGFSVRCLRDVIPTVSTSTASNVTATSATTGGNVTHDGGEPVTARGVAYGTSSSPTTSGFITNDGTGTGVFTSTLTGLTPSTTYYVRAYATNNVGTVYGNEMSFTTTSAPALAIGMSYAGGIIFDLDSSGQHGMVCAPSNQGNFQWGCFGTDIPNTSTAVGTGATNTASILAGCSQRPIAASVCADLVLNGYSDWYLPSFGEVQLMISRLHLQGLGGFGGDQYWSSSQYTPYSAWAMYFFNGVFNHFTKNNNFQVRAVRAF